MQTLVAESESFRIAILRYFASGIETKLNSLSSIFIIQTAVDKARGIVEHELLEQIFVDDSSFKSKTSNFYRRAILAYIEVCSSAALDRIFLSYKLED